MSQATNTNGLAGLVWHPRVDQGQGQDVPPNLQTLTERLVVQRPKHSMAAIHRHVTELAPTQGWLLPSHSRVDQIHTLLRERQSGEPL
jgi:putative transposase